MFNPTFRMWSVRQGLDSPRHLAETDQLQSPETRWKSAAAAGDSPPRKSGIAVG
ncbi:hypothetical protein HMPREF0281_01828 [Corynebacterium ammoniagenes DSM 20306]|uniref:Uncharacterized protein n=1 Tax=Corynebacterium ammoniagenes DSM 20306 TaxID=649754 RepID=A0ABN0ADS9_CORAM|nr:hypothetical protein HMPREF0281_01828 [Corynebacterium ammoniagenes DSM 20306]